ncbi:hypothetical protein [Sphingomonas bacterium]|uniref:hypothetical protein n=1 Tax=Sphingomonas bacterium TaxID=1895847 RepID=UPI00157672D8|nr:hypothetical protein [Sphingomonas bacterium]
MKAQTLRKVRLFHNYIAVFFAPAILFFAFTGGLQTAGLHERHGDTAPPRWIVAIANLHKHQTIGGHKRPRSAAAGPDGGKPHAPAPAPTARGDGDHDEGFVAEKPFVVLLALALFVTTALGLVIAVATPSTRRMSLVLIAAGIVVPLVLLL